MRKGKSSTGRYLRTISCPSFGGLSYGITVSRRYGNSPERNRFKRLVREAIRLADLSYTGEVIIFPLTLAKQAKCADIQNDLFKCLTAKSR